LALRYWDKLLFATRVAHATRQGQRFYAECATLTKGLPVHSSLRTRLDVYRPEGAVARPVLVYVYGGSWRNGDRTRYAPLGQRLLPEGFVVVVPDYTTFPAARYPQPTQEIAAAIAWTLENIERYGGDPKRVVVGAHSAGAQIAGLAVLDPRWLGALGHSAAELRGFVGVSGVYDLPLQSAHLRRVGGLAWYIAAIAGGEHNLEVASPSRHIGPLDLPVLLIHGRADAVVPAHIAQDFHKRLQAAGVPSELIIYPDRGHGSLMYDALLENPSRLIGDFTRFMRRVTAPPAAEPAEAPS
jgi:acetyl esterase/lipase